MAEHAVATADEIPEGTGTVVEVDGLPVAVYHVDGEFYAITNRCLHKGGPLGQGYLHRDLPTVDPDRKTVHCPWHYWEFDLETGRNIVHPETGVRTFEVRTDGDEVIVRL